jgi:hypothetical protein
LEIQKLTSQNKSAILLLIFSALLIFFDPTASLIFDLPRQLLEVIALIYVMLIPLYLTRKRPAYVIGIFVAAFVVFFFRTRIPSHSADTAILPCILLPTLPAKDWSSH